MKKTIASFLVCLMLSSSVLAGKTDSLLHILDKAIAARPQYNKIREAKIDSLKRLSASSTDGAEKYRLYFQIFREYRSYNMDSAMKVAREKKIIAGQSGNQQNIYESEMNISEILGIMGMYKESIDILDKIDKQKLDKAQKTFYFHLHHSLYIRLSEIAVSANEKEYYATLLSHYKDSLLLFNEPGTSGAYFAEAGKLAEQERYDEALKILHESLVKFGDSPSLVGMFAYELSEVYRKKGDEENEKKYLIISSISDIKRAAKTYVALRKLAILLYQDGDVDRAYQYIKCAMEDATFCKARFRTLQISETLPIIVAAYDKKMNQEKENLFKYLILISLLSVVLIVSILFIYRQMNKLSAARQALNKMYEDVKEMNSNLNDLNKKLSESNHIKEEYIGFIFNLCSSYIDKMEAYRKNINRKLKSGQIEEASKITNSTSLVFDELKEFFRNFDAIFLNIYPNFVEEFNELLQEGEKITPKAGDLLSPELRVFALVRLGITESSKIANFLHYSPQTVYNYNLKVRSKLAISKEEFSEAIQQIGK